MTAECMGEPLGTLALLERARQEAAGSGELVRLIMGGVHQVDSWLIGHRILPSIESWAARKLRFTHHFKRGESKSAVLIPLPDGGAFACSASGQWFAFDRPEALSVIQHIGFRHAPQDRWEHGFEAHLEAPGEAPAPVTPFEVAAFWAQVTGTRPAGFEGGALDEVEALGLKLVELVFDIPDELGL